MDSSIIDVIKEKYTSMTKKQRMLADYMISKPESMSFMTLKELSERTNISEVTILNACTVLGCTNYNELKYEFRKYISLRAKSEVHGQSLYGIGGVPDYELDDKTKLLDQICQEEYQLYTSMFRELDMDKIFKAANMLLDASNIIICARGVSVQAAEFLSTRLATMGLPSVVMNTELNDSVQSILPLFNSSMVTVAISLPDYYIMTTKVCEFAKQKRSSILCLTDSSECSPVADVGNLVLKVPSTTRLFLNSPGPMISLINIITSCINIEKSSRRNKSYSTVEEFSKMFHTNAE